MGISRSRYSHLYVSGGASCNLNVAMLYNYQPLITASENAADADIAPGGGRRIGPHLLYRRERLGVSALYQFGLLLNFQRGQAVADAVHTVVNMVAQLANSLKNFAL